MSVLLEVCVDDIAGLDAAQQGGADRVELCSSLGCGGLTPSAGLMAEAATRNLPVIALIRPRSGGFVYSEAEARIMLQDIALAAELGLAGVAIGALTPERQLDRPLLERLIRVADGRLQLTLHRAFDLVRDPGAALEVAIALGFQRVLTSGGASSAWAGSAQLAALVRQSQGRIRILAGSGIRPDKVAALLAATGVHEVHASCRLPASEAPAAELLEFGFSEALSRQTSAEEVRAMQQQISIQEDRI
ncbi:copper homeostasis protein CutC [Paucibacter sp. DJ1R-11]|uniref:copper homeostasis protein CutC n=1 Tax=Paucibacter sp. DJ1R-11 TaxID=2893556 RepID=UPI0021E3B659|nr:copper homeostasis protein CutC [Paucibacter sp. DJ1R-11]MCV2361975.1 copper homeostasis protein CutC [Paucibacter sp. DJ1R-11]